MVKTKNRYKKVTILALLVVVLCAGVGTALYVSNHKTTSADATQPTTKSKDGVNLEPATKADEQRAEDNKQKIIDKQKQAAASTTTPSGKKTVTPIITYADQYNAGSAVEVGGGVDGIYEDGGTCTATFTSSTQTFNRSSTAVKNVNSVDCPAISVASSDFNPKGNWSVTLSYSSSTASGISQTRQVEVK